MKRRAMAGLLAMTMAATMFAGCGSTAADSQTADAQGSAGTATEAAKTEKGVLPESDIERSIFLIRKKDHTSKKYPRKAGLPGKQPL